MKSFASGVLAVIAVVALFALVGSGVAHLFDVLRPCAHDGRLDSVDYKQVWSENITQFTPTNSGAKICVCKRCGKVLEASVWGEGWSTTFPVEGASGFWFRTLAPGSNGDAEDKRREEEVRRQNAVALQAAILAKNVAYLTNVWLTAQEFNDWMRSNQAQGKFTVVSNCQISFMEQPTNRWK